MTRAAWPPLRVTGGALWLGRRMRFAPEGLVVDADTLPWGGDWFLDIATPDVHGFSVSYVPRLSVTRDGVMRLLDRVSPFHRLRIDAADAFASYLGDTPAVRPCLTDPARTAALLRALRAGGRWWPAKLPHEPLMGDAHDLHWAVLRGLDRAWPRRYDGRPVAGEPVPATATLVAAVRAELPSRLHGTIGDDRIAARLAPYRAVRPWPFGVLAGA